MPRLTPEKLVLAAVRAFAATLVVTIALAATLANGGGCTNVKGQDTATRKDFSRSFTVATTQSSETLQADRYATTRSSGGATSEADYTARVLVSRRAIEVEATDHNAATTQPTTITVLRDANARTLTEATKTDARTANAVTDDTKTGPTVNGNLSGGFKMDGLTVNAPVESTFKRRWPLIAGLAAFGLYFTFAPLALLGNPLRGVGLLACAAAALILSNFWLGVLIAAVVVIGFWPDLKKLRTFGRVVEVLDDWKSDMPAAEKEAFNDSLATATKGARKTVDRLRVERKHKRTKPVIAESFPSEPAGA